jgi:type 1 glutamine amidotransferase
MNRSCRVLVAVLAVFLGLLFSVQSVSAQAQTLKALVVTGQNNHGWQVSSPILKQILEQTGLFEVDVATSPPKGGDIQTFKPNFAGYDVVVLDYNGELWPEQTRTAFVDYVRSGGGVVVYHAADNSFGQWKEYNEIIGLGGWGGRDEKSGPYIRWRKGKAVRDMSPGRGGSHGPRQDFQITIRNKNHSITKGLPAKWMHAKDELYSRLRGPAENLTVLATAYDDPAQNGTGEHEPVLFTVGYGKGRVFHTVLGHVGRSGGALPAMECVGFITTFQRGAEWAATGKVTQEIPADFPTDTEVRRWKDSIRSRPLDELLADVAKYEHGQSRRPLTELTDLVSSASGSPKALKGIEKSFNKFLGSDAALSTSSWAPTPRRRASSSSAESSASSAQRNLYRRWRRCSPKKQAHQSNPPTWRAMPSNAYPVHRQARPFEMPCRKPAAPSRSESSTH